MDDGSYNYDHLFAKIKDDIESSDISIVNQEVILGGRELGLAGYPAFNGAYEVSDAISNAGFDVVLHATNHALDKGKTGLLNCLNNWKEKHKEIAVLGIHDSEESYNQIYMVQKNGIKISILNYTYGTNGIKLPKDMPYAVDLLSEDKVAQDIECAKKVSDFIIVCPHWGTEYQHTPSDEEKKWA